MQSKTLLRKGMHYSVRLAQMLQTCITSISKMHAGKQVMNYTLKISWEAPFLCLTSHSESILQSKYCCAVLKLLSHVQLSATPQTVAHQVPLSMGFSRPEYWSGLPCPPQGDLPNPGIQPRPPTLQADSLSSEPPGKPKNTGVGSLSLLQECRRPRFNPCVRKIPLRGKWQPTPVFLPGKYLGQRDLVSYSPWSPQRVRHDLSTKPLPPFILIWLFLSKGDCLLLLFILFSLDFFSCLYWVKGLVKPAMFSFFNQCCWLKENKKQ